MTTRAPSLRPRRLDKLPIMAADYTPSDDFKAEMHAWEELEALHKAGRERFRAAIARELLEHPEATTGKLAKLLKWSDETLRGIAREHKVPRKRPPTVRSIKDKPDA